MQFEIIMTVDGEEETELAKGRRSLAKTATWHQNHSNSGHIQKPSNARPTQLNANIEQATAATDAKVAIVFVDRMTGTPCRQQSNSVRRLVLNNGENSPR
jgi:mannose/fructose-specific phosphotransferase system component IIA